MKDETIFIILTWYIKLSEPNQSRIYYRCPVCNATWHKDGLFTERHNLDCWIPHLQNDAQEKKIKV